MSGPEHHLAGTRLVIASHQPPSRWLLTTVAGGMRRLTLLESLRCSTAVAGDLALGSAASLDGPLPDMASLQQPEPEASTARPPLMLQNKLPRWNEGAHNGSAHHTFRPRLEYRQSHLMTTLS